MADHLIERVRECEKAAIERKRQVQSRAKELVETARRDGEKRLAIAERDAREILSASETADTDAQDKLLHEAKEAAQVEAAVFERRRRHIWTKRWLGFFRESVAYGDKQNEKTFACGKERGYRVFDQQADLGRVFGNFGYGQGIPFG